MSVNTAKIDGRRKLDYKSYDELLADADRLSSGNAKTLGNWSPGQIFQHLANAFNGSIDGLPGGFPWFIRVMARIFKKKLIAGPMPAGVKMPDKIAKVVMPQPTSTEVGLANLHAAVSRLKREPHRATHPVFGEVSNEEWDTMHLKHASLHMSFLAPLTLASGQGAD
jgi:Protein of unknown function (DUF1569)